MHEQNLFNNLILLRLKYGFIQHLIFRLTKRDSLKKYVVRKNSPYYLFVFFCFLLNFSYTDSLSKLLHTGGLRWQKFALAMRPYFAQKKI